MSAQLFSWAEVGPEILVRSASPAFALRLSGVPVPVRIRVTDIEQVHVTGLGRRHVLLLPSAESPHPTLMLSRRVIRKFAPSMLVNAGRVKTFAGYRIVRACVSTT